MLKPCSKQEFAQYAERMYALALVPSKSSYPTYNDGIKTKQMFLDRAAQAFSSETEEILLFEHNGAVEGWVHYYWIPEERYLSTVSFPVRSATEEALEEFLDFARGNFRGYDLDLGYPAENEAAAAYLMAHGFPCIEETYNHTAFLETLEPAPVDANIVPITRENYACFRALHTQAEADMYWTADRIAHDLEHWAIFVKLADGEPVGTVYTTKAGDDWFEIFGIDTKDGVFDQELFQELLNAALRDAKRRGGKFLTFFCEEEGRSPAGKAGLLCVGKYVCYRARL